MLEVKMYLAALALEFDDLSLGCKEQGTSVFDLGYTLMAGPLRIKLDYRHGL